MKTWLLLFMALWGLPAAVYGQGSGKALRFANELNYVDLANNYGFATLSTGTISCWIRPEADVFNYGSVFSTLHNASNNRQFPLDIEFVSATEFRLGVTMVSSGNTTVYVGRTANTFLMGGWYHICYVTVAGSGTFDLYVNGVRQTMTTAAGSPNNFFFANVMLPGDRLQIGAKSDNAGTNRGHFSGSIDEMAIWSRALTQAEIRHKMCERLTGTEPGLVAYYRMDEGADNTCPGGQDVCDATGNGNHGVKF